MAPTPALKSSSIKRSPSIDINIIAILKDYIEGRSDEKYLQLLKLKNDPNVNDDFLLIILQQVNSDISCLVPKVQKFVDALLSVSWISRPAAVLDEYLNFVQSLVSAHSYYCKTAIGMLVSNLKLRPDVMEVGRVHLVLKEIWDLVPLFRPSILDSLHDCFPYIGSDSSEQVSYVKNLNLFAEITSQPPTTSHLSTRSCVLNIITGRLVKLDSRIPREELLKLSNHEMDFDENSVIHQASQTLDEMMKVMFELCRSKRESDSDGDLQLYFDSLYSAFEMLILTSFDIHHAHFLMFYVCSFKSDFYKAFIQRLLKTFKNPSSSLTIRKSSAGYLASFLGKATFVPVGTVTHYLKRVCQWIHEYLDQQEKAKGAAISKIGAHTAFYAGCHIAFYVIAARHRVFLDVIGRKKKFVDWLKALNLTRIVESPLNPLRYCHPKTVTLFAESASQLQILSCDSIMDQNRNLCQLEASSEASAEKFQVESGKFEQYLLSESKGFVLV